MSKLWATLTAQEDLFRVTHVAVGGEDMPGRVQVDQAAPGWVSTSPRGPWSPPAAPADRERSPVDDLAEKVAQLAPASVLEQPKDGEGVAGGR